MTKQHLPLLLWIYGLPALGLLAFLVWKHYSETNTFVETILRSFEEEKYGEDYSTYRLKRQFSNWAAWVVTAALWPIALSFAAYEKTRQHSTLKRHQDRFDAPQFTCSPEFLEKQLSVADAEAQGIINDPRGMVPNLPFGFLNRTWVDFISSMTSEDELWSFAIPEHVDENNLRRRRTGAIRGFALVRDGLIRKEFIYESN